ncbi:enamine deaminase RidA (YjgF/YER057c/UK114 family) [Hydrogenophaga palleronii]|uniref:Enamine deaminase RidA (YjgF/YER057c/UK114 family) n=1 Tax=Hydrogenophaga palleronii TaxID=65655 RepID=A0ABU1WT27_9BURK|nr:hypothetical protein [Hydrogenophaga palleronii]MDR7152442.1 enamine deaminase RidA (YjgF/YER057c/UK114 family) [Hydrogenophaga palleronii]
MALDLVIADSPFAGEAAKVLGGALLGMGPVPRAGWPLQHLGATLLGSDGPVLHETWLVDGAPVAAGHSEGIDWRRCGDLLYGVIELAEDALPANADETALQVASKAAYARIFRLLDAQGLPHLWRAWNYLADIHGDDAGLERYRRFNMGRGSAFEQASRSVVGRVPAACALGVAQGPLSVAFLAGTVPAVPIENPRQVSAYLYPREYGPRSPTFSRAALVYPPGQELLFISGTASIVGHRSLHDGDVQAQSHETLDNIAAVVAEANRVSRLGRFTLDGLSYRVYVRHAEHFEAVRSLLRQRCGDAPTVYLQADVCRVELLVEIEAMAGHTA